METTLSTARFRQALGLKIAIFASAMVPCTVAAQAKPSYPESRIQPVVDRYGDVEVVDAYRWLEDQTAPDTRDWIAAQNRFREQMMAGIPGVDAVAERLGDLLRVDVVGTPVVRQNRYFFTRRGADQDLLVIYMREGPDGTDVPLVDPHLTAAEAAVSVTLLAVSRDGSLLAYGVREGGQDELVVRFLDVEGRQLIGDDLEKARYFGVEFTPDNQGIYFVRYDSDGPRLYYRALTGEAASEQLIYGQSLGPEKIMFGSLSPDGQHLIVTVSEGSSGATDLYLVSLDDGVTAEPMIVGTAAHSFPLWAGDRIVVQTDLDAPNGRVLTTTPDRAAYDQWQEIVSESEHALQFVSAAGGYIWLGYLENVIGVVRGFDLNGNAMRDLELPSIGSISEVSGEFDQDEAFFTFTSYNTPPTTFRYSITEDTRDVWSRPDVEFDSESFEVSQVWYESRDGTRIPMFLAHRADMPLDGDNPTLLTGYGGFSIPLTPGFNARYAVWLERGGVLAVPSLRGGGEFGEAWHQAGMFERKQNVFDDFIAAAEWLISNGYTSPEKLAIAGGSNGGLLVGAAMTQRPELFRAVVCAVPLLDMLRYQNFLVALYWVSEYGSSENPDQFEYLRAYSPYHNVTEGVEYPAVLFTTGDGDTRVAPLHARKMTALLQDATGSANPVLLRYDTEAGHSGGLPVTKVIEDLTSDLSFLMWQLGMTGDAIF